MAMLKVAALFVLLAVAGAANANQATAANANPIRRVVSMLQAMQGKLDAEHKKGEELYDKFMCWCSSGAGALQESIDAGGVKMPQLKASIEEDEATKVQTAADLKAAQAGRSDAKAAMAEATAIRNKEAGVFAKDSGDFKTNLAAMGKAIGAIESGMGGAFLQTTAASTLKQLAVDSNSVSDFDRNLLVSFLAQGQGYAPQSGQITGILKQMQDTMTADLAGITTDESAAVATFDELMAAKAKEVAALTKSIETKTIRIGELGVAIAQQNGDLDDTTKAHMDDSKFLADLDKNCAAKKAEWAVICKTRGLENAALADTIEMLNSDDALEMFKKTLPGSSASLIQQTSSKAQMTRKVLSLVRGARSHHGVKRVPLDLLTLALTGKKVDMSKVSKLVDELVGTLNKEQTDDNDKKEYCETQMDALDDKKKSLERDVSDLEKLIAETTDKIATTKSDLEALAAGIKNLDKEVAESTDQRKEENSDYKTLMAGDTAAKELIGMAKNRLNKFYNPSQYKAPPKRELTDEERAMSTVAFVQISAHRSSDDEAPAPPPAAPTYKKNSEGSTGVLTMMDMLTADLDKEMQEAEVEEKNAQEEYEDFMADSASKRADDSTSITDKEGAKADMEVALEQAKKDNTGTMKELMATEEVLSGVHGECDWLLNNFDSRKAARTGEIESLKKAKAVLAGADFSLVQTSARALRR